jgi:hypothetical protein
MAPSDEVLDRRRYARRTGDPDAVHVGLGSDVARVGYPSGYRLALGPDVMSRLARLGAIYGLRHVGRLESDAGSFHQPVTWNRMEAALLAQELQWLSKVSVDPVVLDAADQLRALAEECKSSTDERQSLLIRFT